MLQLTVTFRILIGLNETFFRACTMYVVNLQRILLQSLLLYEYIPVARYSLIDELFDKNVLRASATEQVETEIDETEVDKDPQGVALSLSLSLVYALQKSSRAYAF